ncbi:lysylphosphatidylglycerol synthase transmembrane domain-containing protein [Histidinibacterium aquaticum]|uniref:Flippase-like domain-containing protein n=1 Tax=Histidinibacterium aquaticum TaxID=2613962 RepID=A0A5J5GA14_9RHOB|nr:lysylphosphatidylglycerol synthase transmembrane domain-containing protein [Histidinibacterium aquaticum]KAA9005009.1 flippase-like domain-containing protein [Histidinibacterium aquaticum]
MGNPFPSRPVRPGVTGIAWRALHIAVPLAIITAVISAVGAEEVIAQLRGATWGWIAAALAACAAQTVLSAIRWRLTAQRLGLAISEQRAVAEYFLSSLVNTTVPGGVLGDAWRAVRSRSGGGLEPAAQSVLIERMAGQIALGAVLVLGLAVSGRPLFQGTAALVVLAVVALLLISFTPFRAVLGRSLPTFMLRFATAIRHCWSGRLTASAQVSLSVAIVVANIATFVFAARATGTVIGLSDAILAVPLILFAMLIPLSVAGWGYREGTAVAVFTLIGFTAADGLSASVIFGVVVFLAALPGLMVLVWSIYRPGAGPKEN